MFKILVVCFLLNSVLLSYFLIMIGKPTFALHRAGISHRLEILSKVGDTTFLIHVLWPKNHMKGEIQTVCEIGNNSLLKVYISIEDKILG